MRDAYTTFKASGVMWRPFWRHILAVYALNCFVLAKWITIIETLTQMTVLWVHFFLFDRILCCTFLVNRFWIWEIWNCIFLISESVSFIDLEALWTESILWRTDWSVTIILRICNVWLWTSFIMPKLASLCFWPLVILLRLSFLFPLVGWIALAVKRFSFSSSSLSGNTCNCSSLRY
jgi:hypothetical protein